MLIGVRMVSLEFTPERRLSLCQVVTLTRLGVEDVTVIVAVADIVVSALEVALSVTLDPGTLAGAV